MAQPIVSQRKATATFNGVLLVGLGFLAFTGAWWPNILAVIGVALALRQYLRGRLYDVLLTTVVFGGLFLGTILDWSFNYFVPVLLTTAGVYLLINEWFVKRERVGDEEIEDAQKDIEDAEHPE